MEQCILKDPNVANYLPCLQGKYNYVVLVEKMPNNIVLLCKSHYTDCLIK